MVGDASATSSSAPWRGLPDATELVEAALLSDKALLQETRTIGVEVDELAGHLDAHADEVDAPAAEADAEAKSAARQLDELREIAARRKAEPKAARGLEAAAWATLVVPAILYSAAMYALGWPFFTWWLAALVVVSVVAAWVLGALVESRRAQRTRDLSEVDSSIAHVQARLAQAEQQVAYLRFERGAKEVLRAYVNERRTDQFRTTMTRVDYEGLAELLDPAFAVETTARERLDGHLKHMPGGSIGLSGPRGAGKTTLIRSACPLGYDPRLGQVGVVVSAPVRFDGRDFILHLFAELCGAILGRERVDEMRTPVLAPAPPPARARRFTRTVLPWAAIIAGVVLVMLDLTPATLKRADLVGGVVLLALGLVLALPQTRDAMRFVVRHPAVLIRVFIAVVTRGSGDRRSRTQAEQRPRWTTPPALPGEAARAAERRLEEIWFQQTFTKGWSGALKLPVMLETGIEGQQELARQQLTLPEIVEDMRRLVELTTNTAQVRIGIDELDKIESTDEARTLLNELKALFGMPGCFFLVSVSEDAMSIFERRGLPFRDVFDSALDEVVHVGYLDAAGAVRVLQRRLVGMPIPFMLACHCLAGGLPRDVLRVAREIIASQPPARNAGVPSQQLADVVQVLVADELKSKCDSMLVALRTAPPVPGTIQLQEWLRHTRNARVTADRLREYCESVPPPLARLLTGDGETRAAQGTADLVREFLAYCLLCATMLEFFSADRQPHEYQDAFEGPARAADRLAEARQAFTINPYAAWASLNAFRDEVPGLARIPDLPDPAPIAGSRNGAPGGAWLLRFLERAFANAAPRAGA